MKKIYLLEVIKSSYCKLAFVVSLFVSYILIPPTVFNGVYSLVAVTFMVAFSLSIMCIVRNVKEKVLLARTYKSSLIGIIATALGISALQVCGVGAPVCGASIGLGVLSAIFPGFFVNFLEGYSIWILAATILLQVASLYFMKCFSKTGTTNAVPGGFSVS